MSGFQIVRGSHWQQATGVSVESFVCGYCNMFVSSDRGFLLLSNGGSLIGKAYVCPSCNGLTSFLPGASGPLPSPALGSPVQHVPDDLNALYEEARRCTSHGAYTAAVLLCRKMLMNIAVSEQAETGKTFAYYVDFLADKGFVPPNGRAWVDHIRRKGNEATHEIAVMDMATAKDLVTFTEMLLKFIYEFPCMITHPVSTDAMPTQ